MPNHTPTYFFKTKFLPITEIKIGCQFFLKVINGSYQKNLMTIEQIFFKQMIQIFFNTKAINS